MSRLLLVVALYLASFNSSASGQFFSYSVEGPGLTFFNHQLNTFKFSQPISENTWDFCDPSICAGFGYPGVSPLTQYTGGVVLSDGGTILAHEMNTAFSGLVNVTTLGYPALSQDVNGSYVSDYTTTAAQLGSVPNAVALGVVLRDGIQQYATWGKQGSFAYQVGATLDPFSLPVGYSASNETEILVQFFASWVADGQASFFIEDVFHETFKGNFNTVLELPKDLGLYPVSSTATYGTYNIIIQNRIAFEATPVPEPHSYALMLIGFLWLRWAARSRKARVCP
jgi:hypothetical protein